VTLLDELVEHGLLIPDEEDTFPVAALDVAVQADRLFAQGLEPRHLRTVRIGADRAVDVLEQLIAPLSRNRSPDGRRRLTETLDNAVDAIGRLQAALLETQAQTILDR
jgi:hypothetical protein